MVKQVNKRNSPGPSNRALAELLLGTYFFQFYLHVAGCGHDTTPISSVSLQVTRCTGIIDVSLPFSSFTIIPNLISCSSE